LIYRLTYRFRDIPCIFGGLVQYLGPNTWQKLFNIA